ncbi:glutathione S-transferase family protein [Paraglaciecola sp. 2405UD69-4]|uniref:glutathione S-transferase family protein n=1 Tax=Paraglaciecola sp. 2405UD69-4 TaxID=3391836 RepID=UPI0039C998CE
MIKLYSFGANLNVPDPSPFVLKINLLLQVSNQPFEVISGTQYLQKAPKGKLPYIEDGKHIITDSFFIEKHLKDTYGFDIDSHLSTEQKAISELACASLEERLYWCIVHFRWVFESNWAVIKPTFFGDMPFPLNRIIPKLARKGMIKAMKGHGIGRHSEAEILQIAASQLQAMSNLLGNKDYFFNGKLSLLDVCSYSMLAQILLPNMPSPLVDLTNQYSNLVAFCERIHTQYYS